MTDPRRRGTTGSQLERNSTLANVLWRNRAVAERLAEFEEAVSGAKRGAAARVNREPGFILHSRPWSESSLLLDVLTRDYGRVFLVAKGAKRPSAQYRGLLQAFCPLLFTWSGKKEAKNLIRVDWKPRARRRRRALFGLLRQRTHSPLHRTRRPARGTLRRLREGVGGALGTGRPPAAGASQL